MVFEELLKELDDLGLSHDQYAITSSGPLAVRGIRDANDIDIVVTDEVWQRLAEQYQVNHLMFNDSIRINNIELLGNFSGKCPHPSAEQIAQADVIDGRRYVSLEMIIAFKRLLAQPKDLADIKLIDNYRK